MSTRQISCPASLPGSHQARLAGKLPVLGAPACALLACTLTYTSLGYSSQLLRVLSVLLKSTLFQSFTYKIWIFSRSFYSMHFSFSSSHSASHNVLSISPRCAARPESPAPVWPRLSPASAASQTSEPCVRNKQ